jgi:acyl-CoA reductase-like NAD-dependent aldehyde dehydrogenase
VSDGASAIESRNPANPDEVVWRGDDGTAGVPAAVERARAAFPAWRDLGMDARAALLRRWAAVAKSRAEEIAPRVAAVVSSPVVAS